MAAASLQEGMITNSIEHFNAVAPFLIQCDGSCNIWKLTSPQNNFNGIHIIAQWHTIDTLQACKKSLSYGHCWIHHAEAGHLSDWWWVHDADLSQTSIICCCSSICAMMWCVWRIGDSRKQTFFHPHTDSLAALRSSPVGDMSHAKHRTMQNTRIRFIFEQWQTGCYHHQSKVSSLLPA